MAEWTERALPAPDPSCRMQHESKYMNHAVNWEAISAIGQIVGAIAVVVSLMYLAREIRSNARSARMRFCGQPESVPRTTRNAPAFS